MKRLFLTALILLFGVSIFALTGFGESGIFSISEETLPVELSSFTVAVTAQNYAQISWTTQSESNLLGYYLFRSDTSDLQNAIMISPQIPAHNTSTLNSYSYIDEDLHQSGVYYYWLAALDMQGEIAYHGPVSILIKLEGDQDAPAIPLATGIKTIYPNPFNPSTTVVYQLKKPAALSIRIYNQRGQLVRSYAKNHDAAGEYKWIFDGLDSGGQALSSGIYQVLMKAGQDVSHRKIVLMK